MKNPYVVLFIWCLGLYFVFFELKDMVEGGFQDVLANWSSKQDILLSLSALVCFSAYSLGIYTLIKIWVNRPSSLIILFILLNLILGAGIRYLVEQKIFLWAFDFQNYPAQTPLKFYFLDNLYYGMVYTSLGIIYFYVQDSRERELQRKNLEILNKKNELAFLRSQINPHFLFNTLNNIYSLVYQKSDKALLAMDKLTRLLRYALYEPSEKVKLDKEIAYIRDYIDLQCLRYEKAIPLVLEIEEGLHGYEVLPFSFITFVENAFKHGELQDPKKPLHIHFYQDLGELVFAMENHISHPQKSETSSIGLDNIQKRLNLSYAGKHHLEIKDEGGKYKVKLRLPLGIGDIQLFSNHL